MKTSFPLGLAALGLACASCNFAPKYAPPPTPVPPAYKEAGSAAQQAQARSGNSALPADWWKLFNDPRLNALEDQVIVTSQSIRAAEANYRESRALYVLARAGLFPTASVSGSVIRARSSTTYSSSQGNSSTAGGGGPGSAGSIVNEYQAPLEASYVLDVWGRVRNQVAASAANAQASAADLAAAVLGIRSTLAQDYFQLCALDEQRRILDETVADYRQTLELTRALVQSGIDSDEDLATAQTQLDIVVAQATDLGVARAQTEHAIAVLLGRAPAEFSVPATRFAPVIPAVPGALPSELVERRPDIAAAERAVAAANADIGVARTAYFPSLTLNAEPGYESSHFSRWFEWPSRFWSVGPTLSGTIFPLSELRATNDEARAAYDAAVANYRQAVLSAFQSVEDQLAAIRILSTEVDQQRTAVEAAERYLQLSMTRYKTGIDSALNVATAQNTALSARETLVSIELRQIDSTLGLIVDLGGGWDATQLPGSKALKARPPKWVPAAASDLPAPGPMAPAN